MENYTTTTTTTTTITSPYVMPDETKLIICLVLSIFMLPFIILGFLIMYDGIRHYFGIQNFRNGIVIRFHRRNNNVRINNIEVTDIEKAPIPTIIVEYFDTEDDCPICMEKLDGKLGHLECNHYFHEECLKKWIETSPNSNCPICRKN